MDNGVFRPWDMTDEEHEARLQVREQIPAHVRDALLAWAREECADTRYGEVSERRAHEIQTALGVNLNLGTASMSSYMFIDVVKLHGDRTLLWLVDWLLSEFRHYEEAEEPARVADLRWHLDNGLSSLTIVRQGEVHRLSQRLPDGVEDALVRSVESADVTAGRHLSKAIRQVLALDGDPSVAMAESIKAVEAAAKPVVTPKDQRPQLGKIVGALRQKNGWSLVLHQRDDLVPDHRSMLIAMLDSLAFAQRDRHSGDAPSREEAEAHVLLASTIVGWFSTGAVRMER